MLTGPGKATFAIGAALFSMPLLISSAWSTAGSEAARGALRRLAAARRGGAEFAARKEAGMIQTGPTSAMAGVSLVSGHGRGCGRAGAQDAAIRAAVEAGNKKFMAAAAKATRRRWPRFTRRTPRPSRRLGHRERPPRHPGHVEVGLRLRGGRNRPDHGREPRPRVRPRYEGGAYVIKAKDGSVADRGKYVVVWKKVGGNWMLHRDIWNTNMPPKP